MAFIRFSMPKDITSELLKTLLTNLSKDEDEAAVLYTLLHESLVRFFEIKGLSEPVQAADETIDRVAVKLAAETKIDDVTNFAFGVARYVCLEKLRRERISFRAADRFYDGRTESVPEREDAIGERLRQCLAGLYESDRKLLLEYFDGSSEDRNSDRRQQLADRESLSLNALRNRVSRLKRRLGECLREKE